ncbi:unnamed protein product [Symbiodinium necroappetens]|uniref:Uncharacterized protein n=1 Tax=Symbiodinium necroappetens TaxID=1628268 RepID=A0A812YFC8_9DINO|nr:unnamed protein product [Symbiodinium necroappetens]
MPAAALPLRHPPSCWPNCGGSLLGLHPSFDRQQRLWERGMMRFVGRRQSSGLDFRDLRCSFGTYALDVEFASLEDRGRQEEDMLGIEGATTDARPSYKMSRYKERPLQQSRSMSSNVASMLSKHYIPLVRSAEKLFRRRQQSTVHVASRLIKKLRKTS